MTIVVTVERDFYGGNDMRAIQSLAARFPGQETLQVNVGASRLKLGARWRVAQCTELLICLSEFGDPEVVE
jgi:hypothetical protein